MRMMRTPPIVAIIVSALVSAPAIAGVFGTGGTMTSSPTGEIVHSFTNNGTFSVLLPGKVKILLVGGGGGGGAFHGGGGGGGGVIYEEELDLAIGSYEISIGNGGAGSTSKTVRGSNGGDTMIATNGVAMLTAIGGGGGGSGGSKGDNELGAAGGSGGGGSAMNGYTEVTYRPGGAGTENQGHDGGAGRNGGWYNGAYAYSQWWTWGGGGGGAGEPGEDAHGSAGPDEGLTSTAAGKGGEGRVCDISGESVVYASGGGGGDDGRPQSSRYFSRPGGTGAGEGGSLSNNGGNAVGYGSGGGGGGSNGGETTFVGCGGNGMSGIVIISYMADPITPPEPPAETTVAFKSVTVSGEVVSNDLRRYTSYVFTGNGTISVEGTATADVLLVGGGGGGGFCLGGGGGAGGFEKLGSFVLASGTYTVFVGSGGAGATSSAVNGGNGAVTILAGLGTADGKDYPVQRIVYGGGGGASSELNASSKGYNGLPDASGGGGTVAVNAGGVDLTSDGGSGIVGQGNSGGGGCLTAAKKTHFWRWSGGGGGAGTAGGNGWYKSDSDRGSGKGGDGLQCDFSGTNLWYAGGGGGGANGRGVGSGGKGGGGAGGDCNATDEAIGAENGTNGFGGGGGGGWAWGGGGPYTGGCGGDGGSGTVIIRVRKPPTGLILIVK